MGYDAKVVDFKEYETKVVVAFEEELPKELETNLVDFAADCGRPKEKKPLKEYEAKVVDFADCGRLKAEEPLEENEAKLLDFAACGRLTVSDFVYPCTENSPEFSVLVCF